MKLTSHNIATILHFKTDFMLKKHNIQHLNTLILYFFKFPTVNLNNPGNQHSTIIVNLERELYRASSEKEGIR